MKSICRSCGREITWIKTANGKNMPCDPEKIRYKPYKGEGVPKVILVKPDGSMTMGTPDPASELYGYQSHFATCPAADAHRKRGKSKE